MASAGFVQVHVQLDGPIPAAARADLTVEGTIHVEQLHDVTFMSRPPGAEGGQIVSFYRLTPDGSGTAERTRSEERRVGKECRL